MSYSSDEEIYEKIDDYLYEPMDDKPVQEQQENTPVVGESVGDKAITSCPAYENTTSFTATGICTLSDLNFRCHTFLPSLCFTISD